MNNPQSKCKWYMPHQWSKWSDGTNMVESFVMGGSRPALLQERYCLKCNLKQRKIVSFKYE